MKKIMYIYGFIVLVLFLFVPGYLSADTYFDWEQVNVSSLPEASKDFMNKVYITDDKYYVVKEIQGEITPLPLNENLNGKTIYIEFPENFYETLSSCDYICNFANTSSNWYIYNTDFIQLKEPDSQNLLGSNYGLYYYYNSTLKRNAKEYTFNFDFTIKSWVNEEYSNYFSLTPFVNTYEWIEIDKYQVKEIRLDERDFYLFYSFDDIKEFNILSNYDLDSFTDFQKIVICLGFNILFLGIISLSIYIFIKLVYKGISMIFKF